MTGFRDAHGPTFASQDGAARFGRRAAYQICNGLGAGNIGDEFMAYAFWGALPEDLNLAVEVLPNASQLRQPYPSRYSYVNINWDGTPMPQPGSRVGLLVGDTPVTDSLSLDWPLRFLAQRLDVFHEAKVAVDALGVGVEPLQSDAAREVFRRSFLPIRSWTVRSSACRDALLELGVPAERVVVGADWAWRFKPCRDDTEWGGRHWRALGADLARPLIVVNVVNEIWRARGEVKQAIAQALDELVQRQGFQVAFFCNEIREGEFFDRQAAEDVRQRMSRPTILVPNLYYSPDEVLGLLAHAALTVATRYHFTVASVLAGKPPACLSRSAKTDVLIQELGLDVAGTTESIDPKRLVQIIMSTYEARAEPQERLSVAYDRLRRRAERNLHFWPGPRDTEPC